MPWIDAFAASDAENRSRVMGATWGHLAARRNAKYKGFVTFVLGVYDSGHLNPTVLDFDLCSRAAGELDGGPWFYDFIHEWLQENAKQYAVGNVYRFDGFFQNYRMNGEIKLVYSSRSPENQNAQTT